MHAIINSITNFFKTFLTPAWTVFVISMLPLVELRGGIPIGVALGLPIWKSYLIAFLGSSIPAVFIILFIGHIFNLLRKIGFFDKLINKINEKTLSKKEQIDKYGYIGLMLFVGIPLPGTGAWTGSLLAHLMNMDKKKSIFYVILGNAIAAVIMSIISGAFKVIL